MDPAANAKTSTGPLHAVLVTLDFIGGSVLGMLAHTGSILRLYIEAIRWVVLAFASPKVRLGLPAIVSQIVRVGVRSIFIVSIVSAAVGVILALQLSPPLDEFGRRDLVANILGIAIFRELGPLMGAVVLTGFAGASIAAEIGTMVVSEEIEALEAHALNPVRFLVVPRIVATVVSMTALAVIADLIAIIGGLIVSIYFLDIPYTTFMTNLLQGTEAIDFITGVGKGAIFGAIIGAVACANGLKVSGGAAGVGNATTYTVVQCVVAIVLADLIFTAIFYAWELF